MPPGAILRDFNPRRLLQAWCKHKVLPMIEKCKNEEDLTDSYQTMLRSSAPSLTINSSSAPTPVGPSSTSPGPARPSPGVSDRDVQIILGTVLPGLTLIVAILAWAYRPGSLRRLGCCFFRACGLASVIL